LANIRKKVESTASVIDCLAQYFHNRNIGDAADLKLFLRALFEDGRCLLLLDGLDEVGKAERESIRNWLELHVDRHQNNRTIVTSRHVGYVGFHLPANSVEVTILPFNDDQVKRYIFEFSKSYHLWETHNATSNQWVEEAQSLVDVLTSNDRLRSIARNPFMLAGMALIQRAEGRLPRHRVQFYDIFARCLCETWNIARCMVVSAQTCEMSYEEEAIPIFGELALRMHREFPAGRAPKEYVLENLSAILSEKKSVSKNDAWRTAQNFLKETSENVQLFIERGPDEWGFMHLTFQEYFVSAGLHYNEEFEKHALNHLFYPGWEEIIRLGVGYLAIVQGRGKAAANFINEVMNARWPSQPWVTEVLKCTVSCSSNC
jgi:predicted NACHT family NTPase